MRDHLDYPGEYGPSTDDVLRSWLAGDGQGTSSWRGLLDAPLKTDECHGWEDSIKLCTPEGTPNYIPIVTTYTIIRCLSIATLACLLNPLVSATFHSKDEGTC